MSKSVPSEFDIRYRQLRALKTFTGAVRRFERFPGLSNWCAKVRSNPALLSNQQLFKLYKLDFDFGFHSHSWLCCYFELIECLKGQGAVEIQKKLPKPLRDWLFRRRMQGASMSVDKLKLMNRLKFDWRARRLPAWDRHILELEKFKKRFGHGNVPLTFPENQPLSSWLRKMRRRFREKQLTENQIARLEALGVHWAPLEGEWIKKFEELTAFKREHGHLRIPKSNKRLKTWVSRFRGRKNQLRADQMEKLKSLGFDFRNLEERRGEKFEKNFQKLKVFLKENGHTRVPQTWKEDRKLAKWVARLREQKGGMPPAQIRRLDRLGFDWGPREAHFEKNLKELIRFRKNHGHCRIPVRWKGNVSLGRWIQTLRNRRNHLKSKWIKQLDRLGFEWNPNATDFETRLKELEQHRNRYGHCRLLYRSAINPALGDWAKRMRDRKQKLSQELITRLDRLGFEWDPDEERLERHLKDLMDFKERFGHFNVSRNWKENPSLGMWVHRVKYGRVQLSGSFILKLEKLGFFRK